MIGWVSLNTRNSSSSFFFALQNAISEVHLYPTAQETLIKMMAFLISWIISILCYYNSIGISNPESNGLVLFGGSVVLYCISILLEVFDRIDTTAPFSRVLQTTLIIFSTVGCLSLGLVMIFVREVNIVPNTLITLCVIPVCLYAFDTITYFLIRPPTKGDYNNQENTLRGVKISN